MGEKFKNRTQYRANVSHEENSQWKFDSRAYQHLFLRISLYYYNMQYNHFFFLFCLLIFNASKQKYPLKICLLCINLCLVVPFYHFFTYHTDYYRKLHYIFFYYYYYLWSFRKKCCRHILRIQCNIMTLCFSFIVQWFIFSHRDFNLHINQKHWKTRIIITVFIFSQT